MLKRTDLKNVVEEIVKEELDKLINEGRYKSSAQHYKKALSEAPEIGENEIAPVELINVIIRIIKPDNNVLYDISKGSGSFKFNKREIFYTTRREILFNKKSQKLKFEYLKDIEFKPGIYNVEVYTENYMIGKSEFIIK